MRLSNASLDLVPSPVRRPAYDRAAVKPGIVHLGIGAFHRAHQAIVIDDLLATGPKDWGIVGASLRSPDTRDALTLREASYPAVQYIPRRDVDMAALTRSEHTSFCPYKGEASYYSIPAGGDRSINAVWTYETPFEAMKQIKEYVAFYPDRVDQIS